MFFKRFRRCNEKLKAQYSRDVQKYLKDNSFIIVQRLKNGMLNEKHIEPRNIKRLLGSNYPRAPWISKRDVFKQAACLFKEVGYTFSLGPSGDIIYNTNEMCKAIIQNYLNVNGKEIMDRLAECCKRTHGRLSYKQLRVVLGVTPYRVDDTTEADINRCTLLFMKETKLPFKHNDTYIYLP